MQIGVSLPNNYGVADAQKVIELAVAAEELGYASVWTAEHLINLSYVRDRIGDGPYYHPLSVLSFVAARTRRIALGTSIIILPFHHPIELAKYVATLDQLSNGRVVLGVGVGNIEEEFDAMGVAWRDRGALTNEALGVMKALWTEDPASFAGRFWSFEDVHAQPKPLSRPHVPLWVGGSSAAAKARAVKHGGGWHPVGMPPETFRDEARNVRIGLQRANRDPDGFAFCVRVNLAFSGMDYTADERSAMVDATDSAAVKSALNDYADAGATHCILAMNSSDAAEIERAMREIARVVLPWRHP